MDRGGRFRGGDRCCCCTGGGGGRGGSTTSAVSGGTTSLANLRGDDRGRSSSLLSSPSDSRWPSNDN